MGSSPIVATKWSLRLGVRTPDFHSGNTSSNLVGITKKKGKRMKKIALCFLTYDDLSKPNIWKKFVETSGDRYTVYIHNKTQFVDKHDFSGNHLIPGRISTRYAHISLVKATLLLFKEALKEKENEYFILLSNSCIPLLNNREIYKIILEKKQNIISSYPANPERFLTFKNKNLIDKSMFMKQNQWFLCNRKTAEFFVENDHTEDYGDQFRVPDEHYFTNIVTKYGIPFANELITFVNWSWRKDAPRPKTYEKLSEQEIEDAKKQGFLFFRKVSPQCILPDSFKESLWNEE